MALSYVGTTSAVATGTTTATPTVQATTAAGDRVYVCIASSPPTSAITVPNGWTELLAVSLGTTATPGANAGPRRVTVLYRDWQAGDTMPGFAVSGTGQGITASAHTFRKAATEVFVAETTASGSDTTAGSPLGPVTGNANLSVAAGDIAMMIGAIRTSAITFSAQTLTGNTGATNGTVTERSDGGTANGHAVGQSVWTVPITAGGPSTAAPISQATLSGTGSDGGIAFVRVRVIVAPVTRSLPPPPPYARLRPLLVR